MQVEGKAMEENEIEPALWHRNDEWSFYFGLIWV